MLNSPLQLRDYAYKKKTVFTLKLPDCCQFSIKICCFCQFSGCSREANCWVLYKHPQRCRCVPRLSSDKNGSLLTQLCHWTKRPNNFGHDWTQWSLYRAVLPSWKLTLSDGSILVGSMNSPPSLQPPVQQTSVLQSVVHTQRRCIHLVLRRCTSCEPAFPTVGLRWQSGKRNARTRGRQGHVRAAPLWKSILGFFFCLPTLPPPPPPTRQDPPTPRTPGATGKRG